MHVISPQLKELSKSSNQSLIVEYPFPVSHHLEVAYLHYLIMDTRRQQFRVQRLHEGGTGPHLHRYGKCNIDDVLNSSRFESVDIWNEIIQSFAIMVRNQKLSCHVSHKKKKMYEKLKLHVHLTVPADMTASTFYIISMLRINNLLMKMWHICTITM